MLMKTIIYHIITIIWTILCSPSKIWPLGVPDFKPAIPAPAGAGRCDGSTGVRKPGLDGVFLGTSWITWPEQSLVGGLEHGFYVPFHIWDVILTTLTNSHIFQDGYNHQPDKGRYMEFCNDTTRRCKLQTVLYMMYLWYFLFRTSGWWFQKLSCFLFARKNESPFVDGPGWPSTTAHQINGLYSRNSTKFVCMIEQCFQKSGENQGPELVRSQLSKPRCSQRMMRNMGHLNWYPLPNRKWHTRDSTGVTVKGSKLPPNY